MAASFNQVLLVGNVTRSIEVRYTPKGTAVADIGLAVNEKYKTESGETREDVVFVDCTAWGKTAEICGQYLDKGSPVLIQGKLKMESWDDKATGQKRSKLKVTVERVQFLGSKGDRPGGVGADDQRPARAAGDDAQAPAAGSGDDQIPF